MCRTFALPRRALIVGRSASGCALVLETRGRDVRRGLVERGTGETDATRCATEHEPRQRRRHHHAEPARPIAEATIGTDLDPGEDHRRRAVPTHPEAVERAPGSRSRASPLRRDRAPSRANPWPPGARTEVTYESACADAVTQDFSASNLTPSAVSRRRRELRPEVAACPRLGERDRRQVIAALRSRAAYRPAARHRSGAHACSVCTATRCIV